MQTMKNALNVRAPNSTLEGCQFQNWGTDLTNMNSAIFVERSAEHAKIQNNRTQGQSFGIWVDATRGIQILNNKIQGMTLCARKIAATAFIFMRY